jgi:hypothetical protein
MNNGVRFQFLRDSKGQPVGCVAIKTIDGKAHNGPGGYCMVEYQFSVLNPLDHFDRTLARDIASHRLEKRSISAGTLPHHPSMHHITERVMEHLATAYPIPSRAKKAAKLWLRTHKEHS